MEIFAVDPWSLSPEQISGVSEKRGVICMWPVVGPQYPFGSDVNLLPETLGFCGLKVPLGGATMVHSR
jgi:hypothetical protein